MERIMTIGQASAKIDLRLNKGASGDYDNLWKYQKKEALNKAILSWVRRQKRGKNLTQEGDEESRDRVDDLQVLLKTEVLKTKKKPEYNQTDKLPDDYLFFKRLTPYVSNGICSNVTIKSHLREEANVDDLKDMPSFEMEETFHTLKGNRAYIYHFGRFIINKVELTYYRLPIVYDFKNMNEVMEFKDDVCEQVIDEACKIIASDIESPNQKALADERIEKDN